MKDRRGDGKEENKDSVLTQRSEIRGRRMTISWSDKWDAEGIEKEEQRDINVIKERMKNQGNRFYVGV